MARSPNKRRRLAWDACAWIAQIWNEQVQLADGGIENRGALCRAVLNAAVKGDAEICTSALSLVEVCKHPASNPLVGADMIKRFFENDYIIVVPLDRRVGELAREFMQRGYAGLKPPDAAHLASAAVANADEMHTFDDKLLKLDGKIEKVDGTMLKICKPSMGGQPLPLLESGPMEEAAAMGEASTETEATAPQDPSA